MELSIIIPVYNTSDYVRKLLDELIRQKKENIEIIVINDGSTEDMKFLNDYKDIILIEQENKGVSIARNVGLDLAQGKYIAFCDSDDMISNDYIEIILNAIKSNKNYYWVGWKTNVNSGEPNLPMVNKEPIKSNWAVWGYVIKNNVIGTERFKNIIAEDIEFLIRVLKGDYEIINKLLYIYNFNNENSISHKINRGEKISEF